MIQRRRFTPQDFIGNGPIRIHADRSGMTLSMGDEHYAIDDDQADAILRIFGLIMSLSPPTPAS